MSVRMIIAAVAGLLLSVASVAQASCPHTRARTVNDDLRINFYQDCGGITFKVGGTTVDTNGDGCPLLAIYKPEHEIEVPSTSATRTEFVRQDDIKFLSFQCERDWFLFIPLSAGCSLDQIVVGGVVDRMRTIGCAAPNGD